MKEISFKQKIILMFLGIFLSVVVLEAGLRLAGWIYLARQDYSAAVSFRRKVKDEYRILCLGDSTTAFGGKDSYPAQMENILNQGDLARRFTVINRGIPGLDSAGIVSQAKGNIKRYSPDMIIALMGINDEFESLSALDAGYKMKSLIRRLRVYKLVKLFVLRLRSADNLRDTYFLEGVSCLEYQRYREAERMFAKVIKLSPEWPSAHIYLSQCYYEQGRLDKAEELIQKAEALAVNFPLIYSDIGWRYSDMGFLSRAEEAFKKAIEAKPLESIGYHHLAQFYQEKGRYPEAERMFKKAMRLSPDNNYNNYIDLGMHYFERGMLFEAEDALKKAVLVDARDPVAYWYLGYLKKEQGHFAEASSYFSMIQSTLERINKAARANFNRLRNIAVDNAIVLVAVQYPMRKLDSLKNMFSEPGRIIFVDNEAVFREALKKGRYEDYFIDRFAGDFGHCTAAGNQLLARNIASAIARHTDVK